jgi:hypothetical protein
MTLYFLFFPDNAVKVSQMPSGREEKGDWVIPSEFARIVEVRAQSFPFTLFASH